MKKRVRKPKRSRLRLDAWARGMIWALSALVGRKREDIRDVVDKNDGEPQEDELRSGGSVKWSWVLTWRVIGATSLPFSFATNLAARVETCGGPNG